MTSNIFQSLNQILNYLQDLTVNYVEVKELLDIYKQFTLKYIKNSSDKRKYLFIVFEGLDGSGKSTMTKLVSKDINAGIIATPPTCIQHLRSYFDNCEPKLRRAYFSLGNYIASMEIEETLKFKHVIMDRFWNSTAAYALAESVEDIPERGSSVYVWPSDLLKPDIIIFLNVAEKERLKRTSSRILTVEEDKLKNDEQFRQRLYKSYSFMENLTVMESYLPPKKESKKIQETILAPLLQKYPTEL